MSRRVVKQDQPIWNPRFVAYAKAHGREPDEQLEHDRLKWLGGGMVGFMCWNRKMIKEWGGGSLISPEAHDAYDAWLQEKVGGS